MRKLEVFGVLVFLLESAHLCPRAPICRSCDPLRTLNSFPLSIRLLTVSQLSTSPDPGRCWEVICNCDQQLICQSGKAWTRLLWALCTKGVKTFGVNKQTVRWWQTDLSRGAADLNVGLSAERRQSVEQKRLCAASSLFLGGSLAKVKTCSSLIALFFYFFFLLNLSLHDETLFTAQVSFNECQTDCEI